MRVVGGEVVTLTRLHGCVLPTQEDYPTMSPGHSGDRPAPCEGGDRCAP